MSELKEYVVTAINYEVLDDLCNDIEKAGGGEFVPSREVSIANERPISRNTHYFLTDSEAEALRKDPRVVAVELLPSVLGMKPEALWTQTGYFNKSSTINSNDKNWGLLRVTSGSNLANWGTNGSFTRTGSTSVTTTLSGKNVDVVVVDAHLNPDHPEFAVNADGTGGSRVNLFDWFTLSESIGVSTVGSYQYGAMGGNHGTHTAGTIAGNTQGWARDANIYNINFSYTGSNTPAGDWTLYIFDYIRAFHNSKPINPATGRRNPTITTNSWGYSYGNLAVSSVSSVTYRGVTSVVTGSSSARKIKLESNGVPVVASGPSIYRTPATYAALNADVEDAIADGIIVVASAGNSYWNMVVPTSIDYQNNFVWSGSTFYGSQGSSPGNATGVVCVGAAGTQVEEYKASFSNFGSRVDIYAPGQNITSSVYDSTAASEFGITLAADPRNASYYIGSISGTSMACPQVAGYIACLAEEYPNFTNTDFLNYIVHYAKQGQIGTTGNINQSPYQALGDASNNVYLYFYNERKTSGNIYPRQLRDIRPTQGVAFPRSKIRTT